ncbi:hypothetical protein Tdes44962_MAKER08191, partial [Teratosphaeria destructans]
NDGESGPEEVCPSCIIDHPKLRRPWRSDFLTVQRHQSATITNPFRRCYIRRRTVAECIVVVGRATDFSQHITSGPQRGRVCSPPSRWDDTSRTGETDLTRFAIVREDGVAGSQERTGRVLRRCPRSPRTPALGCAGVEDEAHSLRQLASSRDDFPHPNNVPGPPQEPPRGPYLGLTEQQRFAMGLPEQNVNLRSGLTPLLSDYSQWWDTQSAAAPYQFASPYLPTTQAESLSFPEPPSYHQSQQRDEDQPDQQDPPWSRRA